MFFTTNKSYVHLYPREEDYNPTFQTVETDIQTAGTENEDEEDESVDLENVMIGPQLPPAPPVVYSEALIDRLRANALRDAVRQLKRKKSMSKSSFRLCGRECRQGRNLRCERSQASNRRA